MGKTLRNWWAGSGWSEGRRDEHKTSFKGTEAQPCRNGRADGPSPVPDRVRARTSRYPSRSARYPHLLSLTMAANAMENINGVSNALQWSPGICCELRIYLLASPLFFEWAEFEAKLEHIASTDLLQSVISEQPLLAKPQSCEPQ